VNQKITLIMLTAKKANKYFALFSVLFITSLFSVSVLAQDTKTDNEPQILVTETGVELQVAAWDVETIYDPTSYSWVYWETPIFESVKTKSIYSVRMSDFDKAPVFTKACAVVENAMACTNDALQDFMKSSRLEYPAEALNNRQEGLEYVTFILTETGTFEGRPTVLSKDNPCAGCAEKAVEIVKQTENLWQPAIYKGKPVKVKLTIPVRFDLTAISPK